MSFEYFPCFPYIILSQLVPWSAVGIPDCLVALDWVLGPSADARSYLLYCSRSPQYAGATQRLVAWQCHAVRIELS